MRLVCWKLWSGLITEGEYCVTSSPRIVGWGQDSSRAHFFVLDGLTGMDICISESSRGGEGGAEVVLVGLSMEEEVVGVAKSWSLLAALSSGAFRFMSSFISCSWGCLFVPLAVLVFFVFLEVASSSGYWSMRVWLPVRFEPPGRASSFVRS